MSQPNQQVPKEYIRIGLLMHTAIAGASIAAVVQLASRESMTQVLLLSVICFAITIPTSVAMIFISQLIYPQGINSIFARRMEMQKWPVLSYLIAGAEQCTFFGGFLALFWSFQPVAGVIFLAASILAVLTAYQVEKKVIQPATFVEAESTGTSQQDPVP